MSKDKPLRAQLVKQLEGGMAFTPMDELLPEIPFDKAGKEVEGLPYTLWQLFWHIKFTQWDILDFSRNPGYQPTDWPEGYWPKTNAPANEKEWKQTIAGYLEERAQFIALIKDESRDLYQPFAHGSGQNLLHEALLIIAHTAYHYGEMLVIMRLLGLHKG